MAIIGGGRRLGASRHRSGSVPAPSSRRPQPSSSRSCTVLDSRRLATGHDVWVVVFPEFVNGDGTGRVVVYEDGNYDFSVADAPGG